MSANVVLSPMLKTAVLAENIKTIFMGPEHIFNDFMVVGVFRILAFRRCLYMMQFSCNLSRNLDLIVFYLKRYSR